MKKLVTLLMSVVLLIGGCSLLENRNSREYMEKHFSYLEKIYPTRNVEKLFEKYPNGLEIVSAIIIKNSTDSYSEMKKYNITVDSVRQKIYGTLVKVNIDTEDKILYEKHFEYQDGNLKYDNDENSEMEELSLLFQTLSYSDITQADIKHIRFENQRPTYSITYKNIVKILDGIDGYESELVISDSGHENPEIILEYRSTKGDYIKFLEKIKVGIANE